MGSGSIEHHTVIIVGGGPAGLPLSVVLGGWHPHFSESPVLQQRYAQLADYLRTVPGSLLSLNFHDLLKARLPPVDLFRLLHHPRQLYERADQIALNFRRSEPLDCLLITQEEVGGVWNNVPENMLTLSPGQWMEFAFYPLAEHVAEQGIADFDVNELIGKRDLVDYYHRVPVRFEQMERIRTFERVTRIQPHEEGFLLTAQEVLPTQDVLAKPRRSIVPQPGDDLSPGEIRRYTCKYLVYAAGQRVVNRRLGVQGEDLPFVYSYYDRPSDFHGERVMVVGGGRSADWAATELHDAGKQTCYVMRQPRERHWRLVNDSRMGLPYYARLADIFESGSPRWEALYDTSIECMEAGANGSGLVTLSRAGEERTVEVDCVVVEIGSTTDFSLFEGFPVFQTFEKYDPYRFQIDQLQTHPHNYESIDVPNLYPGGYLAQDIGLVVIAMHGTTYAIAADILRKEGRG